MVKVSVVGATGYAGAELMRLLSAHSEVSIMHAISKSFAGRRLSDIYPSFLSCDFALETLDSDAICADSEIVFTCLPHGASAATVPQFLKKGMRVIDLSGDFRYSDVNTYEAWYKLPHAAPRLLSESVYGMPELYREHMKAAQLVGNPGCYTTCAILALYPLLKANVIEPDSIIIDAKSGTTGAGRSENIAYNFCEVDEIGRAHV